MVTGLFLMKINLTSRKVLEMHFCGVVKLSFHIFLFCHDGFTKEFVKQTKIIKYQENISFECIFTSASIQRHADSLTILAPQL